MVYGETLGHKLSYDEMTKKKKKKKKLNGLFGKE